MKPVAEIRAICQRATDGAEEVISGQLPVASRSRVIHGQLTTGN
jgi:hypothetical protein